MNAKQARKMVLATRIPAAELAVRILEAQHGLRRPAGATAEAALNSMGMEDREGALRAAKAAMLFFAECVSSQAGTVQ